VEMSSNDVSRLSSVGGDLLIYAGMPANLNACATVVQSSLQFDFFVGVRYVDGPSTVINSPCGELSKGGVCYAKAPSRGSGTYWCHSGKYVFPSMGRYKIEYVTGYIDSSGNLVATDSSSMTFNVDPCNLLITTGVSWLDQVVWCFFGRGVTVFVLALFFGFLLMLFLVRRRRR